ncbi:hypothetical protein SESBI_49498 [Sesbania bispinosa]|nr:hypothetical protein SESBI_49498 [Sesbania bispinosa]
MENEERRWRVGMETLALLFPNYGVLTVRNCLPMRPINPNREDAQGSSNFWPLVGTCPYMCPERERVQREKLRDLAVFERLNGNPRKSSPVLAVKKFCRTISSKNVQASDVRPPTVLEDTLNYLLNLLESKEHPFEVLHDFIFDRTRSIRQDLTMQNIVNKKAIYMYEKMVKFHVVSHYKLWCSISDPNIASMHHLNMEQLTKTLASLFNLYEANRNSNYVHENEAEFHSLYVLLHLGSHSKPMGEPLSLWFSHLSAPILKSKEMLFARGILRSFRLGNYKDFFCTVADQASYLQYCIMEPYINEVRALALSYINFGGYKLHPYPLFDLSKHLMIKMILEISYYPQSKLPSVIPKVGSRAILSWGCKNMRGHIRACRSCMCAYWEDWNKGGRNYCHHFARQWHGDNSG